MKKKTKLFLDQYIIDGNLLQTVKSLGYRIDIDMKECKKYLKNNPSEWDQLILGKNQTLVNIYAIAYNDPSSFLNEDGSCKGLQFLSNQQRLAVKDHRSNSIGKVYQYIFYDKQKALEQLMKHEGLYDITPDIEEEEININIKIDPRSKNDG